MSDPPTVASFAPGPPDWRLDWSAIDQALAWIRDMRGCAQNPLWHAEGDVWIHTRMVCEALAGMPAWRELAEADRSVLFTAALLHDVAKPQTTRTEADGRITSRGHSRRGAIQARRLLWQMGLPFPVREEIAALIGEHQLPFFLIDRDDARRRAITASLRLHCGRLALLAEADARGRICNDQDHLLDNIDLFRDFCRDEGCLDRPWRFPSHHTRFVYFRDPTRPPEFEAHDDTRTEAVMLSGLPAAGKNHWIAANLLDLPVVALDQLRQEFGIRPDRNQGKVIQEARERARELLRKRQPFIWNATNLSRQARRHAIDLFADYGARIRIVYLETDPATQRQRNAARARPVPDTAITRMLERWEVPDLTQAHSVEWIVT